MPAVNGSPCPFNIHSRIADLRKRGHTIEQDSKVDGRKVKSFYRLVSA
jgi:hypothetical protein